MTGGCLAAVQPGTLAWRLMLCSIHLLSTRGRVCLARLPISISGWRTKSNVKKKADEETRHRIRHALETSLRKESGFVRLSPSPGRTDINERKHTPGAIHVVEGDMALSDTRSLALAGSVASVWPTGWRHSRALAPPTRPVRCQVGVEACVSEGCTTYRSSMRI